MKYFSLILTIVIYQLGFGQNLVLNGDFEDCNCPKSEMYTSMKSCRYINSLVNSSPDYFNSCHKTFYNPTKNLWGEQLPKSGDGFAGMLLYVEDEYLLEYINFSLARELEPGPHLLSFYINWAECSSMRIDGIGFLLTDDSKKLKCKKSLIDEKSQVIVLSGIDLEDKSSWHRVSSIYMASGGEKELVLGTFKNGLKSLKISQKNVVGQECLIDTDNGYYFIDDVRLVPLGEAKEGDEPNFTHQ